MSDKRRSTFGKKGAEIDTGLDGLFSALGQAIGEIAGKLEDGKSGSIARDHVFETAKGPMRAHAGIRLRMGGMDVETRSAPSPQPVNRASQARQSQNTEPPAPPAPTPLSYDLFEQDDAWILTADMPGVARKELTMDRSGSKLVLTTNGKRQYSAEIALSADFEVDQITTTLRNGILALTIPKVAP